jgi:hypothetical protein
MKKLLPSALFAAVLMLGAAPSQAAIIDFTDADAWGGADGNWIYTSSTLYDGVQVTVTSAGVGQNLRFNAPAHPLCSAASGGVLDCEGDGLGIGDDELSYGDLGDAETERIYVVFDQPVDVTRIGFLNLFKGVSFGTADYNTEAANWVAFFSGGAPPASGQAHGTDHGTLGLSPGLVVADVSLSNVTTLLFWSGNGTALNSDFSPAGIEMTPADIPHMPEPATLFLTGGGLLAAAYRARRRRT